ncbi:MAG: type II toxin-antitoxin system PemK/MazF family toxin [Nanoarchaeota archaeon]
MKSGITYKQGEILIVPFPFSDLSSIKQRPVLVLSKNDYNDKYEDIVTCGITSNLKDPSFSVLIDNNSLDEGSVPVKSRIKADKLFTINKGVIRKKIGRINKETFLSVKKEFLTLV